MHGDVLRYLRCPVCDAPLIRSENALHCPIGHSFDIARQGYVNLGTGRPAHSGDTAEMVAARGEFLDAGHYRFISTALAATAREAYGQGPGLIVDAGAGTGHHLAAVLDVLPSAAGLALDAAKPALRRAARAHPRAAGALCDTWRALPVADGAARLVLNVFAPRNGPEFRRILHAGGALLVVTPTAAHLAELVGPLGLLHVDATKEDRVAASLTGWFDQAGGELLEHGLRLTHAQVAILVRMGPSARHADAGALADRIAALPEPVAVTASVQLRRYTPVQT
jgi:23S rRNA (guanine745-N1)-methyltransferase